MMSTHTHPQELADQAKYLYESGNLVGASEAFSEAARAFSSAGDDLMAAEMMNNRSVALLRSNDPQAALEAVLGTEESFQKAGDYRRLGIAYANQASALQALKRYKEAIQAFQKAGDALESAKEDRMRLQVMQLLSALHLRRWKFLEAVIALQSGFSGIKNPTLKERIIKKLLFIRI